LIRCCDYNDALKDASIGDFVYLDPPYHGTFSNYSKNGFDESQHVRLRDVFKELTEKGCKVALSNSDDPFIRGLYKDILGVSVVEIAVKRCINSKGSERSVVKKEILITNYRV
jgi:DNA adenine methylase